METAIELRDLVKDYRGGEGKRFRAVDQLNLTVRKGEILGFLGPNGAGKTTTIKMMLGLVLPDQGSVTVAGLDVARRRAEVLRQVGAVLEGNRNVYWNLTVYENLRYWGTLKEVPPATLRSRIDELLAFFDLTEKRNVIGKQLSRGMQQKLAIACSLLHDPEILLLDEPTLGLDVAAARMVKERVQQLCRERGLTVVLTTHQMDVAQELCQRIAIMTRGQLRVLDETANLLAMFTRQEYEFKVIGAAPEAELSRYGTFTPVEANGSTTFRLLLPDSDTLYGVMDCLQRTGTRIVHVNKLDANLEEVFLQVTQGNQPVSPVQGVAVNA